MFLTRASVRACVRVDAAPADRSAGALHAGLHAQRRLRPVLANDEHAVARLSARTPLLRQGRHRLHLPTYLLTVWNSSVNIIVHFLLTAFVALPSVL